MRTEILYSDKYPHKYKMSGWNDSIKVFSLTFSLDKPLSNPVELFRLTTSIEESDGIYFVGNGRFDYISMKSFGNYSIEEIS